MRAIVFTGPSLDQPRGTQYASKSSQRVSRISVTHLVADTYPNRPGTTMRTGNPCWAGRGRPFIPIASIASRPSITALTGVPQVQSSTERLTSCSAPGWTPASSSTSRNSTPCQRALPTRSPPTGFDTHDRVMYRSICGRSSRSWKDSSISSSTIPPIRRRHESRDTWGTTSAVSMR